MQEMKLDSRQLRACGTLAVATLALMAFNAAAAHAAVFTILGSPITETETVIGKVVSGAVFTVPDFNIEKKCKTMEIKEAKIETAGTGRATLTFSDCHVYALDTKEELTACSDALNEAGGIVAKVRFLVTGKSLVLAEPLEGTTFTVVHFGGKCALPEENFIKGSVIATMGAEAVSQSIKVNSKNGDGLTFGLHKMTIEGEASGELSGKHIGCKWGAS
jgi:hypothetical protein